MRTRGITVLRCRFVPSNFASQVLPFIYSRFYFYRFDCKLYSFHLLSIAIVVLDKVLEKINRWVPSWRCSLYTWGFVVLATRSLSHADRTYFEDNSSSPFATRGFSNIVMIHQGKRHGGYISRVYLLSEGKGEHPWAVWMLATFVILLLLLRLIQPCCLIATSIEIPKNHYSCR